MISKHYRTLIQPRVLVESITNSGYKTLNVGEFK